MKAHGSNNDSDNKLNAENTKRSLEEDTLSKKKKVSRQEKTIKDILSYLMHRRQATYEELCDFYNIPEKLRSVFEPAPCNIPLDKD
ncbi:MAG: hypothetical protein Q4B60_08450 [Erysipelotrichaceae bacterium]|nr:hypothetical protein [Erysipelotrichaceae bacterium]